MNPEEKISISLGDAMKLGVDWEELCEATGIDVWSRNEGRITDDEIIRVPVRLIRK